MLESRTKPRDRLDPLTRLGADDWSGFRLRVVLMLMCASWKTACQIFLQATLLARDELTGSLVQVLLLAVGFEDGQGIILGAALGNQPEMHYGWRRLMACRACRLLSLGMGRLLGYAAVEVDEVPDGALQPEFIRPSESFMAMQERSVYVCNSPKTPRTSSPAETAGSPMQTHRSASSDFEATLLRRTGRRCAAPAVPSASHRGSAPTIPAAPLI